MPSFTKLKRARRLALCPRTFSSKVPTSFPPHDYPRPLQHVYCHPHPHLPLPPCCSNSCPRSMPGTPSDPCFSLQLQGFLRPEQRPRTFATFPDPTHPTNSQNDVPRPKGNNNTLLWIAGGVGAAAGVYYYYYADQAGSTDPHAQLKAEEERLKQKVEELRDAGRATAYDAARDGEAKYEETKVRRAPRTWTPPLSSALTPS